MKNRKNIYEYVENIHTILPRGKEDLILKTIIERFENEEKPSRIIEDMYEEYGSTVDFHAIVRTMVVALDNIGKLQAILNKYADEYSRLYVVGRTPRERKCEWCRKNVEGQIFRLIKNPDQKMKNDVIEDPVFEKVTLLWPQKTLNPEKRWVRADFQHVNCHCSFEFFDPLINVYNPQTQEIETVMDEEEGPDYMQKAYRQLLLTEVIKEKENLEKVSSPREKEWHEKNIKELKENIVKISKRIQNGDR